ncbi:MAG TPA: TIGR03085 family metal-binding protein [Mycobacteriales bacterium]|nr:TIGR03085 family metal-binding protein [Mycobacteriales bacterium]
MTRWAQQERQTLVGVLTELGPDAPTACTGWATADLAAHLYVRERRADAMPGVVLPGALAAHTDRVMASVLRVHSYDHVVGRIAAGPPLALRPFDETLNLFEFFVHTEDVRRTNGLGQRDLPVELERLMWRRLRPMLRLSLRRVRNVQVEFVTAHGDRIVIGSGPTVRLLAPVGELALYAYNRKPIAEVDTSGDPAALGRLEAARLGV